MLRFMTGRVSGSVHGTTPCTGFGVKPWSRIPLPSRPKHVPIGVQASDKHVFYRLDAPLRCDFSLRFPVRQGIFDRVKPRGRRLPPRLSGANIAPDQEGELAMLSREENELITRVGQGSPMGNTMRHYWIPA